MVWAAPWAGAQRAQDKACPFLCSISGTLMDTKVKAAKRICCENLRCQVGFVHKFFRAWTSETIVSPVKATYGCVHKRSTKLVVSLLLGSFAREYHYGCGKSPICWSMLIVYLLWVSNRDRAASSHWSICWFKPRWAVLLVRSLGYPRDFWHTYVYICIHL